MGARLSSGILVPENNPTEVYCERCRTWAKDFVKKMYAAKDFEMTLERRLMEPQRALTESVIDANRHEGMLFRRHRDFINNYSNPKCPECHGNMKQDLGMEAPGSFRGVVVALASKVVTLSIGDVVTVPKRPLQNSMRVRNPMALFGLKASEVCIEIGDTGMALPWRDGRTYIMFARERSTQWVPLGNAIQTLQCSLTSASDSSLGG